jgi:transglutaminase-like putative cysteine protease
MAAPAAMRYRVVHETVYSYSAPVSSSRQVAHLVPRETPWQQVRAHQLVVAPRCTERRAGTDYFGNRFESIFVDEPHQALTVRAESDVQVAASAPAPGTPSPPWEQAARKSGAWEAGADLDVEQYRVASPAAPLLPRSRAWAEKTFRPGRPWLEAVFELTRRIQSEFEYDPEATNVSTSVAEVLELRRGVCQDYAHLMLSALRSMGIAARYVSGYVLNRSSADGTRHAGADASHAWVAAFCPGLGWVAFDPTNGKLADQEFVTLGWGREYLDVTPLRGVVLGAATQQLSVAVKVTPLAGGQVVAGTARV